MILDFNHNNKIDKEDVQLMIAVLLAVLGVTLLIMAFFAPPLAIIDHSIIVASGEVFTFCGAILGVDYHYSYLKHKIDKEK